MRSDVSNVSEKTYETTDLYLGAFLKANGVRLIDSRRDGRRVIFMFADSLERHALILAFYNDGTVRANDFKNALQDLKAIVYNM